MSETSEIVIKRVSKTQQKILDLLRAGCYLTPDRHSIRGMYLMRHRSDSAYKSRMRIRGATIDDMRRSGLLILRPVNGANTFRPYEEGPTHAD